MINFYGLELDVFAVLTCIALNVNLDDGLCPYSSAGRATDL